MTTMTLFTDEETAEDDGDNLGFSTSFSNVVIAISERTLFGWVY